ncbi:hypothetical protein F5Y02DRAFT_381785 [Annulohypoxylon stygium]|nr:hypothetical protein F5Y02DRAFT_381785 [Annulohypoxylon stygium]
MTSKYHIFLFVSLATTVAFSQEAGKRAEFGYCSTRISGIFDPPESLSTVVFGDPIKFCSADDCHYHRFTMHIKSKTTT